PPEQSVAEDLCPICLGTMHNAAWVPECFHRFCFGCIRRWASRTATCPLCRQPFDHLCRSGPRALGNSELHSTEKNLWSLHLCRCSEDFSTWS
uniref:RING-type E3 ubiquitin transferase n=1 Tax=Buteo japonicus TaxID=224669 RepID=A0A8C0AUS1_9AVES